MRHLTTKNNILLPNQLEEQFINQIKQATNYQQLTEIRNNFLAKHLAREQKAEVKETSLPTELKQIEPMPIQTNQERYLLVY